MNFPENTTNTHKLDVENKIFNFLKMVIGYFLLLTSYFLLPVFASAATLSLDPESASYGPGDMFIATVRIDTDTNECVNAATIGVVYPKNLVKVTAVSKGESLMTLWTDEPKINNEEGSVSWGGGIPGGYCGRVIGDPGKTNIIGKIVFSILPATDSNLSGAVPFNLTFASGTQVLLNDGFGSVAPLKTKGAMLTRALHSNGIKNEWLDIVKEDTVPPDQFSVSVQHNAGTFEGKYYIIFSTVDKQSGIDHFEMTEDDPARLGFVRGSNVKAQFTPVNSPAMLTDQSLKSRVVVRAIDNAGNIQEAILAPTNGNFSIGSKIDDTTSEKLQGIWWFLLVIVFVLLLTYYWQQSRTKKIAPEEIVIHDDTTPQS